MRLIVTSASASGHLSPLLAGVTEMTRRGHDVLLVTDAGIDKQRSALQCEVLVLPALQELP